MINMHSYECQAFLIDYEEVGDVQPRFCGFNRVGLEIKGFLQIIQYLKGEQSSFFIIRRVVLL